mgnify:CR=1 FL=1
MGNCNLIPFFPGLFFVSIILKTMTTIYILELEGGYYYVGRTSNLERRLRDHSSGYGSAWTRKYKPVRVLRTIPGDKFDEEPWTLRMMEKYGLDRVRGGRWVQVKLDEQSRREIEDRMRWADDRCIRCGLAGHFVANCGGYALDELNYWEWLCWIWMKFYGFMGSLL